jgi:hypothetical protein
VSGDVGYVTLSVIPSAKGFGAALSKDVEPGTKAAGESAGKRFGSSMLSTAKAFAGPLAAAFSIGGAVKFFGDSVAGASNLSESASKVGVVFGAQASQILAASETAAKAMGLSKTAYLDATGTLGNLLVSLKVAPDAAAGMSQQMVKLAGDLASFNNVSPEEALAAIQSGLTGETEPLKRFGVNMNEAALQAQALKMGVIASTKDALSPQAKALAAQALIMDQTTTAQGDFTRTSGGLANQQRILAAQTEDLKAKIGAGLMPAMTGIVTFLNTRAGPAFEAMTGWLRDNQAAVLIAAGVLTTALLPAFLSSSVAATTSAATQLAAHYSTVAGWVASAAAAVSSGATTAAIWALYAWDAIAGAAKVVGAHLVVAGGWIASAATATASGIAMAAAWVVGLGPIGWIIAGVVAVGAAFVLLYNKVGWFRDGVNAVWGAIKVAFAAVSSWLVDAWNNTMSFFSQVPSRLGQIFGAVGSFITAPFRLAFNAVSALWNNTIGGLSIHVPDWVPVMGGQSFSLPRLPSLAAGATVLPTAGGTVVRVAEAGRAETVVDTGKLNTLLDRALGTGGTAPTVQVFIDGEQLDHRVRIIYGQESAAQNRQRERATR